MPKDLVILVPDNNVASAIRGLLSRYQDFGMRVITWDVFVHIERDPGCLLRADSFLRSFCRAYNFALTFFDRQGCGREDLSREELEERTERSLKASGWDDRCAVVVFEPELEAWIWSGSPHVERVLDWQLETSLDSWLQNHRFVREGESKPFQPKEAFERALRIRHKPRSSALYLDLAKNVNFSSCQDASFLKLSSVLRNRFPAS